MRTTHVRRSGATVLALLLVLLLIGPRSDAYAQEGGPALDAPVAEPEAAQAALGSGFTYQGRLDDGGNPANGPYDFQFKLYDAGSGGAQIGNMVSRDDVPVSGGLFTLALDFGGSAFDGQARFLEIAVRQGPSTGAYTTLTPRRPLLANPYTLYSSNTRGFVVASDGSVGIPSYPQPGFQLDVKGAVKAKMLLLNGNAQISPQDNNDLRISALPNQNQLVLKPGGSIGIGTDDPGFKLDVAGGTRLGTTGANVAVNDHVMVMSSGGKAWQGGLILSNALPGASSRGIKMSASFGGGASNALRIGEVMLNTPNTYTRDYLFLSRGNVGIGTTSPQATLDVAGTARADVVQVDAGADLAEPFAISGAPEPGLVVAIDPDHVGQLRIADKAYDRTVAGIISGAGGLRPGLTLQQPELVRGAAHPVALSGRVYVWADAAFGAIQPGDLLTTSGTPGHAMRVGDYAQAQGAILGKAMSRLEEGKGLVLVLVSLQ